jgi:hypothetical protein
MKNVAEYFNQGEVYYSNSSGQFLRIEEMPFQQAFYAHRKLLREWDGEPGMYEGSHLYLAFFRYLTPPPKLIAEQLKKYGKACHMLYEPTVLRRKTLLNPVRGKFYRAGSMLGHKVKTVQKYQQGTHNSLWMEGSISVVGISVKGKKVA